MKSNKLKLFKLFSLAVFIICVFFASCEMFTPPDVGEMTQDIFRSDRSIELDRREEMVILHSSENRMRSESELRDMVSDMLSSEADTGQNRTNITGVYSYSVIIGDGFSSVTANRRSLDAAPEMSVIPFNVFQLENRNEGTSGFVFTCRDPRIGNLLALVENGDFHDTDMPFWQIFLGCLDEYIDETIAIYNKLCLTFYFT